MQVEKPFGYDSGITIKTNVNMEWPPEMIRSAVQHLVDLAAARGVVITVDREPVEPGVMDGKFKSVTHARNARGHYKE